MKVVKVIKKIISVICICFLTFILIFNVTTLWQRHIMHQDCPSFLGYSYAVVLSGSMSPTIQVDDVVVVKAKEIYDKQDIIMFRYHDSFVTHRIIEVTDDGFITKGDANNVQDIQQVKKEDIQGKVVDIIPHMGQMINFIQSPLGMCICVLLAFGFLGYEHFIFGYKTNH